MDVHPPVVLTTPYTDLPDVGTHSQNDPSAIGKIISSTSTHQLTPKRVRPTFEVAKKKLAFKVGCDKGYCICELCQLGLKPEDHSNKSSVLELCWQMCVQPGETILEKQVAYRCFQDRAAGIYAYHRALTTGRSEADAIFAGEVATAKSVGPYNPAPWNGSFDYLADNRPKAIRYTDSRSFKNDKVQRAPWYAVPWLSEKEEAAFRTIFDSKPQPRTLSVVELHQIRSEERERLEGQRLNGLQTGLPTPSTNYCPELGIYIQENWHPREGSTSPCCRTLVKQYVKRNAEVLYEAQQFRKSAELYFKFCVAFEFPKIRDNEAMEQAAEHLIKVIPHEHLELLLNQRKGKRHYVRH